MPTLSVIVPVYRSYPRMIECIDSILAQTFTDFELILIDDCTPDIESKNYCDEIAQKDSRIRLFHLDKNRGIAGARNFGLEQATGEFIHFSDADDFVAPTMYDECIANLRETNADIVCTPVTVVILKTNEKNIDYIQEEVSTGNEIWNHLKRIDIFRNMGPVWNKIYKHSIINQFDIKFNPQIITADDFAFNLEYLLHVKTLSSCSKSYYHWYCWSETQATNAELTENSFILLANSLSKLLENLCKNDKEIASIISFFFYNLACWINSTGKTSININIGIIRKVRNMIKKSLCIPKKENSWRVFLLSWAFYFDIKILLKLVLYIDWKLYPNKVVRN